ncbi:MAG: ABC transporter permease subunit [Oscillibacter sp.]|nr:ABC transporter permease subunit [Oscillibacter sp.]
MARDGGSRAWGEPSAETEKQGEKAGIHPPDREIRTEAGAVSSVPASHKSWAGPWAGRLWPVLFWLAVWQTGSLVLAQPLLLPSPADALLRLADLAGTAPFWRAVLRSSGRILGGFALGCAGGILLAVPSARFPAVRRLLDPAVTAAKAVPVASFVILALVWLNSRSLAVFIAALMALPPVYLGVLEGIGTADAEDKDLLEMARVFRMPLWARVQAVYLPRVLPAFRTAVSLSLGLCWKAGVAAEVIGLPQGSLGERLYTAKVYFLTADLFAWTAAIVALSALSGRAAGWVLDFAAARLGID